MRRQHRNRNLAQIVMLYQRQHYTSTSSIRTNSMTAGRNQQYHYFLQDKRPSKVLERLKNDAKLSMIRNNTSLSLKQEIGYLFTFHKTRVVGYYLDYSIRAGPGCPLKQVEQMMATNQLSKELIEEADDESIVEQLKV